MQVPNYVRNYDHHGRVDLNQPYGTWSDGEYDVDADAELDVVPAQHEQHSNLGHSERRPSRKDPLEVVGKSMDLRPRYRPQQYSPRHAQHNAKVDDIRHGGILVAPGYSQDSTTRSRDEHPEEPEVVQEQQQRQQQQDGGNGDGVIASLIRRFREDPPKPGAERGVAPDWVKLSGPSEPTQGGSGTGAGDGLTARLKGLNDLIQQEMDHYGPLDRSITAVPNIAKVVTHNDQVEQVWVDASRGLQHKAAVQIQRMYRGQQGRCTAEGLRARRDALAAESRRSHEAAVAIQSSYRGYRARRILLQEQYEEMLLQTEHEAAAKIQAVQRGRMTRRQFQEWMAERQALLDAKKQEIAAVKIQAAQRGRMARRKASSLKQQHQSATYIQSAYRGHLGRQDAAFLRQREIIEQAEERRLHGAATYIQSGYRGFKTRQQLREEAEAAAKIQRLYRGKQGRNLADRLRYERGLYGGGGSNGQDAFTSAEEEILALQEQDLYDSEGHLVHAATRIQSVYRGHMTRRQLREEEERHMAASRLQAGWKGRKTRRWYSEQQRQREFQRHREQQRLALRQQQEQAKAEKDKAATSVPLHGQPFTPLKTWTSGSRPGPSSPVLDASHMSAEMTRVRQGIAAQLDGVLSQFGCTLSSPDPAAAAAATAGAPWSRPAMPSSFNASGPFRTGNTYTRPADAYAMSSSIGPPPMDLHGREEWERAQAAHVWRRQQRRRHEQREAQRRDPDGRSSRYEQQAEQERSRHQRDVYERQMWEYEQQQEAYRQQQMLYENEVRERKKALLQAELQEEIRAQVQAQVQEQQRLRAQVQAEVQAEMREHVRSRGRAPPLSQEGSTRHAFFPRTQHTPALRVRVGVPTAAASHAPMTPLGYRQSPVLPARGLGGAATAMDHTLLKSAERRREHEVLMNPRRSMPAYT